jgi:large subunit ribosomal protein L24
MRKIRKGDDVIVIAGKDKGKRGRVLRVVDDDPSCRRKRQPGQEARKPNPNKGEQGGIVDKEMPMISPMWPVQPRQPDKGDRSASRPSATVARCAYSSPTAKSWTSEAE